jgi:hypothetical protein
LYLPRFNREILSGVFKKTKNKTKIVRVVHLSSHMGKFTCPLIAFGVLAAHPSHALRASPRYELCRSHMHRLPHRTTTAPELKWPKQHAGHGACPTDKSKRRDRRHSHCHHRSRGGEHGGAGQLPEGAPIREAGERERERPPTVPHSAAILLALEDWSSLEDSVSCFMSVCGWSSTTFVALLCGSVYCFYFHLFSLAVLLIHHALIEVPVGNDEIHVRFFITLCFRVFSSCN